ncbi:MAG: HlyC/CorC family transporter [Anaerolineae bacterium]|nr:HlyC/CorC family transporter [Anaerolineae bacterium]
MDDSLIGLMVLGGVILLNAALKMAYVALINTHKTRLKEMADDGQTRAGRALALANDATRLLASQQLIDLLLRFAIALVAALTLVPPLRDALTGSNVSEPVAAGIAYGVVLVGVAILTLVFGEMLPSNIALGHADAIAVRAVGPVNLLSGILAPALRLLQWISGQFAMPFVGRSSGSFVTEEEIKMLVDAGSEGGAIENGEKEMIYSIFQFGDTVAREVMVPRIDMVALELNTPLPEALNTIVAAGHSRIPVYEESIDHIRGLLYAKDLLVMLRDGSMARPLKEILRPAHFVPESKKAVDLLQDLQQRKIHLVIVVDEYGGTAGLVTIEDLIEEIVGEIRDEYDFNEEEIYQQVGENEYISDAGIDLDDLNRLMDVHLPTDESDTLGGYIFSSLGKVPVEGEQLEANGLSMEVLSVDDRRIRKIRLIKLPPPTSGDETEDVRDEPAAAPD